MTDESSHLPTVRQDDLSAMAELLNQSSFGTEGAASLRERVPWRTADQARSRTIGLDMDTLVVAIHPATDIDVEPEYNQILAACQFPTPVAEVATEVDLPPQVVKVLLSDLINQRRVIFRLSDASTNEPSSQNVLKTASGVYDSALRVGRTELADDDSTVSRIERALAKMPATEPTDANLEQPTATVEKARLPARWHEVFWWTDVEGPSPAAVTPIPDLTPHRIARPDDTQQRPEGQRPSRHDRRFSALLRSLRLDAGMSLGELARQINYSKSQVSKIEGGFKRPTPMFARMCDRVLGANGALVAAVPPQQARIETTKPDEVWVLGLDESGSLHLAELPRRQVLAGAGALLGYAVSRNARAVIDERTFTVLRASFDQYRTLGTMTSPVVLLAPVIAHVHTLRTLAVDTPEPVRSDLLLLAAKAAEYAGWLCQEAGRDEAALRWADQAVGLSAGRDPHQATFALFRQAEIALYRHDPLRMVDLARRAQRDTTTSPRILGLAARYETQGYALAGDIEGYARALDRTTELLAVQDEADGPILNAEFAPDEIALVRGWTLHDLGRPSEAADLLDTQLAVIPPSARRARARFGIRRALAHAQHGEIDHACDAAREVLDDVAQVDSATIRIDLRELSRTLGRWQNHHAVRDLGPELSTLSAPN